MDASQGPVGGPDDLVAGVRANLQDVVGIRLAAHGATRRPGASASTRACSRVRIIPAAVANGGIGEALLARDLTIARDWVEP